MKIFVFFKKLGGSKKMSLIMHSTHGKCLHTFIVKLVQVTHTGPIYHIMNAESTYNEMFSIGLLFFFAKNSFEDNFRIVS